MTSKVPKDYYQHMYDIEDLTDLNDCKHIVPSIVVQAEDLIRGQKCREALRLLRIDKSNDDYIEMIVLALWVKTRLFSHVVAGVESKSPKMCALEELGLFLQALPKQYVDKMRVEVAVEADWHTMDIDPKSNNDLIRFYQESDAYVYELMAANHIIQTLYTFGVMAERMQKLGVQNVLDYGAGVGTICILLHQLGYDVTYADLSGKTSDFAKWRFKKRNLYIPTYELQGNVMNDLHSTHFKNIDFDCIVSTEVIEHVLEPQKLLQSFYNKLVHGGVLVVSESCDYTEQFASHLESNKQFGGENFISFMDEIGFRLQVYETYIPQMIFIKS